MMMQQTLEEKSGNRDHLHYDVIVAFSTAYCCLWAYNEYLPNIFENELCNLLAFRPIQLSFLYPSIGETVRPSAQS